MSVPPPPPPPPYGAGGPLPVPQTSSNAVVALVLAIGSFVVCPAVLAVIALVVAGSAQRQIEASGGWQTGTGLVQAARIISWINIGLAVLGTVLFFLIAAVAVSSSSH